MCCIGSSSLSTSNVKTHIDGDTLPFVCHELVTTTNAQNATFMSNFIFLLKITIKATKRDLHSSSAFFALGLFPLRDLTGRIIGAKNILRESGRRGVGVGLHGGLQAGGGEQGRRVFSGHQKVSPANACLTLHIGEFSAKSLISASIPLKQSLPLGCSNQTSVRQRRSCLRQERLLWSAVALSSQSEPVGKFPADLLHCRRGALL